jgi:hypothetical protein
LVRQLEREMVVLAPGTPHWVLTPAAATKVSRNWMNLRGLVQAVHTASRSDRCERNKHQRSHRSEWLPDLQYKPLLFLTRVLRKLRAADPSSFLQQLAQDPATRFKLHLALRDITAKRLSPEERPFAAELEKSARDLLGATFPTMSHLVLASPAASATSAPGMRAPELPPRPSAAQIAEEQQLVMDAAVEDRLANLHVQLPLEVVRQLPGMKQARRNPARQAAHHPQWTRRENLRRLREAERAAAAALATS